MTFLDWLTVEWGLQLALIDVRPRFVRGGRMRRVRRPFVRPKA